MSHFKPALLALLGVGLTGCATVIHDSHQVVTVTTHCDGAAMRRMCTAVQGQSAWRFETPADLKIPRKAAPLVIRCDDGVLPGAAVTAEPGPSVAAWGNVIVGGVTGVAVDILTNRGFSYPSPIQIDLPICSFLRATRQEKP